MFRRIPFSALLARPPVQLAPDESPVPCSVFLHKPDHRGVLLGRPLPHGALLAFLLAPSHVVVRVHTGAEPFLCGDSLRILKDRWLDGWSGGVSVCRRAPAATAAAASLLPARRTQSASARSQASGQSQRSNSRGDQSAAAHTAVRPPDWPDPLAVGQAVGTLGLLRRVPFRGEPSPLAARRSMEDFRGSALMSRARGARPPGAERVAWLRCLQWPLLRSARATHVCARGCTAGCLPALLACHVEAAGC